MYILGLNLIHDTSAALIKDGKIIGAIEEERLNGQKHTDNFPIQSIEWLLQEAGIKISDVDHVVTSFEFEKFKNNKNPFEENTNMNDDASPEGLLEIQKDNETLYKKVKQSLRQHGIHKWTDINHHLSHAAGGYFLSGFKETNILVVDGRGENVSTSLYYAKGLNINLIEDYSINDSLGQLYTYVTKLCGLYTYRGQEGKTMGLSPYGKHHKELHDIFSEIITFNEKDYTINRTNMRKLEKYSRENGKIDEISQALAYHVQQLYEKALKFIVSNLTKMTGCKNLVLSGGVALNCKGNGSLLENRLVDNLYVQPAANDGGTSLGAALYYFHNVLQNKIENKYQTDVYLGPSFSNEKILQMLDTYKIPYKKSENIALDTANLLADGNIIAWFQGSMEFGPRALGNRSILADPRDERMKDKINKNVKFREPWRPFAPSILMDYAVNYFEDVIESPHMTVSFRVKEEMRNSIPAAVHIDGTARIQTVSKSNNLRYYELLNHFYQITGVPVLLNTSFNGPEPMVCSPRDAIRTFFSSGLEFLILGDFIIKKPVLSDKNFCSEQLALTK